MEAKDLKNAATKIQKWWRARICFSKIVLEAQSEYEKLARSIGDLPPEWKSKTLKMPKYDIPNDCKLLFVQSGIANRLAELKYDSYVKRLKNEDE